MEASVRERPKKKKKRVMRETDLSPPPSAPSLDDFRDFVSTSASNSENIAHGKPIEEETVEEPVMDLKTNESTSEAAGEPVEDSKFNDHNNSEEETAEAQTGDELAAEPVEEEANEEQILCESDENEEDEYAAEHAEEEVNEALTVEASDENEEDEHAAEPSEEEVNEAQTVEASGEEVDFEDPVPSAPPPPSYDQIEDEFSPTAPNLPPSYEEVLNANIEESIIPPPSYENAVGDSIKTEDVTNTDEDYEVEDEDEDEDEDEEEDEEEDEDETNTESENEEDSDAIDGGNCEKIPEEYEEHDMRNYNPYEDEEIEWTTATPDAERETNESETESQTGYYFDWDEHFDGEEKTEELEEVKQIEDSIEEKLSPETVKLGESDEKLKVFIQAVNLDEGTKVFVIIDSENGVDKVKVGQVLLKIDDVSVSSNLPNCKDGEKFVIKNASDSLIVADFFDLEEAEFVCAASGTESTSSGTKQKIILKKTVKSRSRQRESCGEKRKEEEEEEEEGEPGKRKKLEVAASVPLQRCCLCVEEKKTWDSQKKVSPLTREEKEILSFYFEKEIKLLCQIHHLKVFEVKGKKCSDPLERHVRRADLTSYRVLDLETVKLAQRYLPHHESSKLKPLMKLCSHCKNYLSKKIEEGKEALSESATPSCSQRSECSNFSEECSNFSEDISQSSQSQPMAPEPEPAKPTVEELTKRVQDLTVKEDELNEMYENIKDRLPEVSEETKMELLNLLPSSWSNAKKQKDLGVGRRLVEKANEYKETGVEKKRKVRKDKLSEDCVEKVKAFFLRRDISKECAGAKQFVSVRMEDGTRGHLPKRLLLYSLEEAHSKFREEHETIIVGLTKFQELRPKNVVLAGSEGTHNICVCLHHQNPKLMISSSIVGSDTTFKELMIKNPHKPLTAVNLLEELTCNPEDLDCCMGLSHCDECAQLGEEMKSNFLEICECLGITEIYYDQWLATDYSAIHSLCDPAEIFANKLVDSLKKLKEHHFLSMKQEKNYKEELENLPMGSLLIEMDFAENYVFKTQDSIQHNYFINRQATIHPCVIHTSPTETKCVVFISPALEHTAAEVSLFIKRLHSDIISRDYPNTKFISFWSDGAPTQYKNLKHFNEIGQHETKYNIPISWSMSAAGHGKGKISKTLEIFFSSDLFLV